MSKNRISFWFICLYVYESLQHGYQQNKYETADQVRADKNNIFQQVVAKEDFNFKGSNSELTSKFLYTDGTMSYFRLGVKRSTTLYSKDLSPHSEENYPNIIIAFNNDPTVQKIAIQTNTAAFKETNIVSKKRQRKRCGDEEGCASRTDA